MQQLAPISTSSPITTPPSWAIFCQPPPLRRREAEAVGADDGAEWMMHPLADLAVRQQGHVGMQAAARADAAVVADHGAGADPGVVADGAAGADDHALLDRSAVALTDGAGVDPGTRGDAGVRPRD